MEYVTERLIEQVSHEIITQSPWRLLSHALIKAQAKDYIRDTQIRVIVKPVIEQLLTDVTSAWSDRASPHPTLSQTARIG